jgi:hypothetical protein
MMAMRFPPSFLQAVAFKTRGITICGGKSSTSAAVWVGHPKVGLPAVIYRFSLGQVGNGETCHGFTACPIQASLPQETCLSPWEETKSTP